MLNSQFQVLRNSLGVSFLGYDIRSKIILFLISLLNQLGLHRKTIRKLSIKIIENFSKDMEVLIKLKHGQNKPFHVKLRLNDNGDYQSLYECLGYMYEVPDKEIFYFLDGGANIGFFSISLLCKKDYKEGILVEPNPENLNFLKFNLKNFPGLKILPYALSKDEGIIDFELAGSNTGHIKGSVGHEETERKISVTSKTISHIIPDYWDMNKTLFKLDIEGAEYDVINEMIRNRIFPKIILGEIHDYLRENGIGLVKALENAGYHVKVSGSGNSGNVCRQIMALQNHIS